MKPLFALLIPAALAAAAPASGQTFQYDTRWYVGVRENVLALQDRHRARIEALETRRKRRGELAAVPAPLVAKAAAVSVAATASGR